MLNFRRLIIGKPLRTEDGAHEKLPKWKALSIFSSDALSSVGYGPEQIIVTLAVPGMIIYGYFGYATLAVIALLAIVTLSYTQVARANPGGGGSYSIALRNLGELPALVAAAALVADYVLTVAVSISSGTEALVSAFPALIGREVAIDILILFLVLTIVNLRGVRESSNVFVANVLFYFWHSRDDRYRLVQSVYGKCAHCTGRIAGHAVGRLGSYPDCPAGFCQRVQFHDRHRSDFQRGADV